ncbi:MAG: metallophosphoesterase [Prevotella sp.]|nr:metallophosphoesterase [Prevotella sp.]
MRISTILIIPFIGLAYTLWHIWYLLPLGDIGRTIIIILCALMFLSIFLVFLRSIDRMPMPIATAIYNIGCSSIIVMLYSVMIFILLDIARFLHIIPQSFLYDNGYTLLGIILVLTSILIYGNIHYYNKKRIALDLITEKPLEKDVKIVMISDLHLGYHNRRGELKRWVRMINDEHPDLILIAGDIIDRGVRPLLKEDMAEELRQFSAPVYVCLGNHEYYSGLHEAEKFYKCAGITLLRDSVVNVQGLSIIGRDDRVNYHRKSLESLVEMADKSKYTIVLDHQPFQLEHAEWTGIDFQFSGHTHHGQIFPASSITNMMYENAYGEYRRGNTHYYVTSGLGIWGGKYRIGTCSEYVVATVKHK